MTELEYVINHFEARFSLFRDKKIILHGSREYARTILKQFQTKFDFIGIASLEPIQEHDICGIPVLKGEALWSAGAELIILTQRVRYEEEAYRLLFPDCLRHNILLYNMYGLNEAEIHRASSDYYIADRVSAQALETELKNYDTVVFELVDVLTKQEGNTLCIRPVFSQLIESLRKRETIVGFSLRKSFSEKIQRTLIEEEFHSELSGTVPCYPEEDIGDAPFFTVRRTGEDLSFRSLKEQFPNRQIVYLGSGLVNEFILPQYYGIHVLRILDQYDCLAPTVGRRKSALSDGPGTDEILRRIENADVISFDIFDTLIGRKVLAPEDIFSFVEMECHIPGFAAARAEAQNNRQNWSLQEIYYDVAGILSLTSEQLDQAMGKELAVEKKLSYVRPDVYRMFCQAHSLGKTIILCSDMYLSEETLGSWLKEFGICGYQKIYVSCEHRTGKTERLFFQAAKENNGTILHIGDDQEADRACEKAGIQYLYYPSDLQRAYTRLDRSGHESTWSLAERTVCGISIAAMYSEEDRLRRFAKAIVAPILIGYTGWFIHQVRRQAYDGVLFFARDGYLVKKLFDFLTGGTIPSVYFYTSRHATQMLCEPEGEETEYVLAQCVEEMLSGEDILRKIYSVRDIPKQKTGETIRAYMERNRPLLLRQKTRAEKGYSIYLKRCGITGKKKFAVCDFFASGSTQRRLERYLGLDLTGLYAGNYKSKTETGTKISYYFQGNHDSLLRNFIEIESIFSSPESSVDYIDEDGTVIFGEELRDKQSLEELVMIQETALETAKEFFELFTPGIPEIDPDMIETIYAAFGGDTVIREAYNDLTKMPIRGKQWSIEPTDETGE